MWPVVKDLCDNGCSLVILVRCEATGRILAYCRMCGVTWLSPADLEENKWNIDWATCLKVVEIPSREEVANSIWRDAVQEYIPEVESFTASEINEYLGQQRVQAALQPVPHETLTAESIFWIDRITFRISLMIWNLESWCTGRPNLIVKLKRARESSGRDAKP